MAALLAMCRMAFRGKTTAARSPCKALDAASVGLDEMNEERGLRCNGSNHESELARARLCELLRGSPMLTGPFAMARLA